MGAALAFQCEIRHYNFPSAHHSQVVDKEGHPLAVVTSTILSIPPWSSNCHVARSALSDPGCPEKLQKSFREKTSNRFWEEHIQLRLTNVNLCAVFAKCHTYELHLKCVLLAEQAVFCFQKEMGTSLTRPMMSKNVLRHKAERIAFSSSLLVYRQLQSQ